MRLKPDRNIFEYISNQFYVTTTLCIAVLVSDHYVQTGLQTNAKSPRRLLQEDQIQGGEQNNQSLSVESETNQIVQKVVICQGLPVLEICCGEIGSLLEE